MPTKKTAAKTRINPKYALPSRMDIKKTFIFLGILLLAIFISLYFFISELKNQTAWRAVFLTNNQVYFGKLFYRPLASTAKLKNIYYLQVSQPLQSQDETETKQQEMKIIKFGNELHRPKDKMFIPKSQILFWEDLEKDSPIVLKIKNKI